MKIHEAANLFPLEENTLDDLAADIKANGQLVPIELFHKAILDGRRRFMACKRAGIKPIFKDVEPDDPISYVISLNLMRRQLSPAERAMIADDVRDMYTEQAKERMKAGGGDKKSKNAKGSGPVKVPDPIRGDTRDFAGKALGVSGTMVDKARKVKAKGVPELVQAVKTNKISLNNAAKLADYPAEMQKKTITTTKKGGKSRYGKFVLPGIKAEDIPQGISRGVGMQYAQKAIGCLKDIPKKDLLRKAGFNRVRQWMNDNP